MRLLYPTSFAFCCLEPPQVTCRLCSERELVLVDAGGKEVRPAKDDEGGANTKAQNVTIGG